MKLRIECNWTNCASITERFRRNYITSDNYDPNLELTTGYDHDVLVVFNSLSNKLALNEAKRVVGFIMEPSWSNNWDKALTTYCDTVVSHTPSIIGKAKIIDHPSLLLHHMPEDIEYFTTSQFQKTKKISFVVRNGYFGTDLYNFRNNLARRLILDNIDVDIFGYGWQPHKNVKGEVSNKKDALEHYMFSICIENSAENNYITEKFHDCILCNTVPIYLGCPNVNEIYNPNGFISLDKNNAIEQIKNILQHTSYEAFTSGLQENKTKYITDYNIYNFLKKELSK